MWRECMDTSIYTTNVCSRVWTRTMAASPAWNRVRYTHERLHAIKCHDLLCITESLKHSNHGIHTGVIIKRPGKTLDVNRSKKTLSIPPQSKAKHTHTKWWVNHVIHQSIEVIDSYCEKKRRWWESTTADMSYHQHMWVNSICDTREAEQFAFVDSLSIHAKCTLNPHTHSRCNGCTHWGKDCHHNSISLNRHHR